MKELMVHVEKAVRPLRITQGQRGAIREELLSHLQGIFDEEFARGGDRDAAIAESIKRFGPTEEVSRSLRDSMPWFSFPLSYVPWFARVRSWPESIHRTAWRAWMTGIQFWMLVGIPWCSMLVMTERKSGLAATTMWFLMASLGVAMLVPFVGMLGSVYGVFGLRRSTRRAVLFAVAGCLGQTIVYVLINLCVNPTLQPLVYAIPFLMSFGMLAMLHTRGIAKLVHRDAERDKRTGEWEQLVLDN